jgi:hypothetical protein
MKGGKRERRRRGGEEGGEERKPGRGKRRSAKKPSRGRGGTHQDAIHHVAWVSRFVAPFPSYRLAHPFFLVHLIAYPATSVQLLFPIGANFFHG